MARLFGDSGNMPLAIAPSLLTLRDDVFIRLKEILKSKVRKGHWTSVLSEDKRLWWERDSISANLKNKLKRNYWRLEQEHSG